jgi:hypothetical protein
MGLLVVWQLEVEGGEPGLGKLNLAADPLDVPLQGSRPSPISASPNMHPDSVTPRAT